MKMLVFIIDLNTAFDTLVKMNQSVLHKNMDIKYAVMASE